MYARNNVVVDPYRDACGKWDAPVEFARPALAHGITSFFDFFGGLTLTRNLQAVIMNVDVNVILIEPRKLERCRYSIILGIFM